VVYKGPFLCIVNFRWYEFCLLVVLVQLSLLAKWLTRKTPWGSLTVARGSSPLSPGRRELMIELVYCMFSSFNCIDIYVFPRPYVIHFLLLWHDIAYLCWKCRRTPRNSRLTFYMTPVRAVQWLDECSHTPQYWVNFNGRLFSSNYKKLSYRWQTARRVYKPVKVTKRFDMLGVVSY